MHITGIMVIYFGLSGQISKLFLPNQLNATNKTSNNEKQKAIYFHTFSVNM